MANLGVFRDDFYNAIEILTECFPTAGPTATGVLTAQQMAGGQKTVTNVGNGQTTAQTYTTDTAVNIIAQLNAAVNAAYKANVGGLVSGLGAQPAVAGLPNYFNLTYELVISNSGTTAASTLANGAGVTIVGLGGLAASPGNLAAAAAAGTPTQSVFSVQVTSAVTVTLTRIA